MGDRCLLVYFLYLAKPAFLSDPGSLPRGGATHSGLGPPISNINQENAPDLPLGQSDGGNSSAGCLSSQVDLGLCQVDKN